MTTTREGLEAALYEIKRVVVGQDAMLERVLVALLTGGHVLLEGVPGLAKTLTVKTLAGVVGGSFQRVQFTPDLVPADLVGTRVLRPDSGTFDVELGPVVCNFLLADEINRAPAKVQSALLEVMEEHQVTIAGQTFRVPEPYLVLATQNPIESEGTYPLPEAQTDRFLMKILVDYPTAAEETAVVGRSLEPPVDVIERLTGDDLLAFRREVDEVYVDGGIVAHAVQLVDATRNPQRLRPGRRGALRRLRRQPARADRPDPVGARARPAAGPAPRDQHRRPRPRPRRPAPPPGALLRRPQRGRQRRPHPRPRARGRPLARRRAGPLDAASQRAAAARATRRRSTPSTQHLPDPPPGEYPPPVPEGATRA